MATQGSSANNSSSVLFREVHKNAWLRRLPANEKKTGAHPKRGERVWTVFCVHDDVEPFLEIYSDQKVAVAHKPEWSTSLTHTLHVSPTICPQDEEFEFVITLPDSVVRLTASSWEVMMEWVDSIGSKLREMRILSPKENVYSRMPEMRAPLLPTRDPNSPLPLPPAVPPIFVPGVEPFSLPEALQDGLVSQPPNVTEGLADEHGGESQPIDIAISSSTVYISRRENSPNVFASSSNAYTAPPTPAAQNVTVIEVSADSFNFNAIGEVLAETENNFNNGHDNNNDEDGEEEEEEEDDDEDDDEDVFSSPILVTSSLLPRLPSQLNRKNGSSSSNNGNNNNNNQHQNVNNNTASATSHTEIVTMQPAATPGARRHHRPTPSNRVQSPRTPAPVPPPSTDEPPVAAVRDRNHSAASSSESANSEQHPPPDDNNATGGGAALYEHIFLATPNRQRISSPTVAESPHSQPVLSSTPPTPLSADLRYSQQTSQERVLLPVNAMRSRSGLRPARRRSSDSSTPGNAGSAPVAADRIRRLQPPPHPFRQNPALAECNSSGGVGVSGGGLSRLTLREQQVLQLRTEMMHPGGVRLQLRRKDCLGSIALVDAFGTVWVAGWKQKDHPMLYNALHIGDQVISVAGVRVQNSGDAQKLIRGAPSLYVAFVIRRVPFGRVFALKRESDGQSLGLVQEGGTAEVKDVVPGGLAAVQGLAPRTPSVDGLSLTTWVLTEVNGRPLNLFFKDNEVRDRLNAVGLDISLLVQPSDLIKQIRKQLKAMRGYKDYIVQ